MQTNEDCELGLFGGHNQDNPTIEWWGCLGVAFVQKQFKKLRPYLLTGASAS